MLEKILNAWNFLSETLSYIIFPTLCPICDEIIDKHDVICTKCIKKIFRKDFYPEPPAPIKKIMRITKYREGIRELLLPIKFEKSLQTLPTMKKILEIASLDEQVKNFLKNVDVAVFVPLHEERLKERGYNQVELIFSDWLIEKNIPVENILLRTKKTPNLFNLTPDERKKVIEGAFETVDGVNISGKNILIVDDIFTTGATVTECAKILKKIDAAQIYVLALASDFGENLIN